MGGCDLITSKKKTNEGRELPARPVNGTSLGAVARRSREIEEQNAVQAKALQEQKGIDAEARKKELLEAKKAERRWVLWDSVERKEWRANPTKQEDPKEEEGGKE